MVCKALWSNSGSNLATGNQRRHCFRGTTCLCLPTCMSLLCLLLPGVSLLLSQVLQASLGELWPRKVQSEAAGQHHQQQHPQQHGLQQHPPMLETIGSGGSCSSMDMPQHVPSSPSQQQQQQAVQQPPLLEQQGSSPHLLYAASSRAATPASHRFSGTGSNSSFIGPASGSVVSSTDLLIRQGSNLSQSARSGSATPRSAAVAAASAAAAAAGQLAPAGSSAEQEQREQQQDMQSPWVQAAAAAVVGGPASASPPLSTSSSPVNSNGPVPALSGPSGAPPPGSLSGWLGGDTSLQKRQQIQQQVLAGQPHEQQKQQQQQQPPAPLAKQPQASLSASLQLAGQEQHDKQQPDQLSQPLVNLELSPQLQQQRKAPRMSCPNPGELLLEVRGGPDQAAQVTSSPPQPLEHNLSTTSSHSADNLAAGWAYPSVSADTHRVVNRTSLAQEQMDGLKAIWGLKAKLQVKSDASGSPAASGPLMQDQLLQQGPVQGAGVHQQQQQQQRQLGPGPYWAIAEIDTAMHI